MKHVHIHCNGKLFQFLLCAVMLGLLPQAGMPAAWAGTEYQWAWMKGSSSTYGTANYGTLGVAAATNTPASRQFATSWTDSSGVLWLFGGNGKDSTGATGELNDLWKYDPTTGYWTWMKGSKTRDASGSYGTLGVAASPNNPGARTDAVSWVDSSGNLWLFGGRGADSAGTSGNLNDLWKFNPSTARWAWMKGSSLVDQSGTYGILGTAAAANTPGARASAVSWVDGAGNLWLFGGYGRDSAGNVGNLNDLWKYYPSSGKWAWMKGSSSYRSPGVYGERGIFDASNTPSARSDAATWTDSAGGMWLFGGYGYSGEINIGRLNDLWKFSVATGNWAWMKGPKTISGLGVFGTRGVAADANTPGARSSSISWADASGGLWLFGGDGYGDLSASGLCNDLWKYDTVTGYWTWVKGQKSVNGLAAYGTLGTPADANISGGRKDAVAWKDPAGSFWLFGGFACDATGGTGAFNDLWCGGFPDRTPPTGSIVINDNRSVTNSANVTLALTWDDGPGSGVVRMKFSNDAVTWSAWESLAATKAWTLAAGEGHKTVRAMFRDRAGNNSSVCTDYIRVDTTPPTGSILINGGASTTTSRTVSLGLTWSDGTGSGVSRMRFSNDGSHWSAWEPPVTPKSYTLPSSTPQYYTVRVQYLDGGNNYSVAYNDYIKLVAP